MTPSPKEVLANGVESLARHLQPDGTLHDEVFGCPTQYGTAYFGWCCAVSGQREWAARALSAALAHTADPAAEPYASGFDRQTSSVVGWLNHRDFTWPPILKTYLALGSEPALRDRVAGVDVHASFRARPPSNWAAVWMSGEWLRMRMGLSPTTVEQFDDWIDAFFTVADGVGFELDLGMYLERGLPNSYDLFTRTHFTDLLLSGYDGRNRERLASFLVTGLRRSLATQLSDGSMASGYRSAGQTWVLGAQIALFTGSVSLGLGSADDRQAARLAAWRAFDSLARWQRPGATFSPVQNLLAPELRVGYERYTSDGHYSGLALGFLASAIEAGFGEEERPSAAELDARVPQVLAEGAPSHRGTAHRGRISVGVLAEADDTYDATGLADLTFGTARLLHFVTAARHLSGGPWLVPGMALRERAGSSAVTALAGCPHRLLTPLAGSDAGLAFSSAVDVGEDADELRHDLVVRLVDGGVEVLETTPGRSGHVSLLIPYLRDLGPSPQHGSPHREHPLTEHPFTEVTFTTNGVRFAMGDESVELGVEGTIERAVDLPYGYESRRGLCGLVRLDLAEPVSALRWSVLSSP